MLLVPVFVAHASVRMNEVAWMGTVSSANAEWIELYNSSPAQVPLDGWVLAATDGSPSISLAGSISGNGYYLLERTSDESVPGIATDAIYSGSLSNTGEHLELLDASGAVVDDLDASSGWPGGDNLTKYTMQWNGSAWITGSPTPRTENVTTPDPAQEDGGFPDGSSQGQDAAGPDDTDVTALSSGSAADVIPVHPAPSYDAKTVIPDFGTAGVPIPFSVMVRENGSRDMSSGRFEWSMGDGAGYSFPHNASFEHVFYYPGSYRVTLTYFSDFMKTEPDSIHRKTVTIVPAAITIPGPTDDGGVVFQNGSPRDIDLAGWTVLSDGSTPYSFPAYTVVPKNGSLSVSSHTIGFKTGSRPVVLTSPIGTAVASWHP